MTGLPLNINIQQIFLHMMNFVILAGGLYFLLYKPVRSFMDKRIRYFADLEKNINDNNSEAENLEHQREDKLKEAEAEIHEMKAKASREAEIIIADAKKKANEESHKIINEAKEKAVKEKDRMVKAARQDIIELVIAAEEKILHKEEYEEKILHKEEHNEQ